MNIERLSCHPEALSTIANWYYHEWGHVDAAISVQDIESDLARYTVRAALPQAVVALDGDTVIGVAELKIREVSLLPQYEHWLGGLYVNPSYRTRGIGAELVQHVIDMARDDYAIETLYLQTERLDGGLYARLGWHPIKNHSVKQSQRLIMSLDLREPCQLIEKREANQ